MKALVTYDYGKDKMDKIRELGYEVLIKDEKDLFYTEDLKDVDVLVCYNPFETLDIKMMEGLKWIQLSSIGIDQAPLDYINDKGIILTNNKGGYSIPIGEWIVMNILQLSRNSYGFFKRQQEKKWKVDTSLIEIYGKTIGFVGTGSIATEAAKRLRAFGVKILGLNTVGRDVEGFDKCYSSDEIDLMLKECDFVVITMPATDKTYRLINKDRFSAMKDGVYFINIARGNIVDEVELINNLKSGKIKGAALDVFEKEPLEENSPLWDMDNVYITPHNSWISEMRNERRFNLIYENLKRYVEKKQLLNIVDLNKGY
ncbi:putative 2-hydroxyacid dehydrogenase [Caloramator mitchellensis]|uniref:Putative 2-hydroxyacid dehydrogenase n=1 Tax=Caloramator mitchellensis TaxID=908809 RepID=A0A0R3JWF1_CALMK|nr:phosphoglycerate dehydrogenase [Caloramator mitchellensis]KRQ87386.1 putative 2-hydroxyacid dehydrogenase [Caloramator mitchellensis]